MRVCLRRVSSVRARRWGIVAVLALAAPVHLPAPTNAAPMTNVHEGWSYIVLSVAGPGEPAPLVALALPEGYEL